MAIDTRHLRVCCDLIGRELWLHDMAGGATEFHRVHVFDDFMSEKRAEDDIQYGGDPDKANQTAEMWIAPLKGGSGRRLAGFPRVKPDAERN